jgi:UDP-N-acetyl-D-mannosaminuronate dehydrogenase
MYFKLPFIEELEQIMENRVGFIRLGKLGLPCAFTFSQAINE